MFAASNAICQKDITQTSCASFIISIFPKKFFWDNSMVCFLLLMLLMPVNLKAQELKDFSLLVEKCQQGLTASIKTLCTHDYKKDPFKLLKEGSETDWGFKRFVGGGSRYLLLSGVTSTAKACSGPIMTIRIITPNGKIKIIRKNAEKMHDYLYEKIIPIERIKVNTMEVFRINEIREDDRERVIYTNRMTYRSNQEGLHLTAEHPYEIKTILCLTGEKHQSEIKEYGYSLLLSDVDVTIWTKD